MRGKKKLFFRKSLRREVSRSHVGEQLEVFFEEKKCYYFWSITVVWMVSLSICKWTVLLCKVCTQPISQYLQLFFS